MRQPGREAIVPLKTTMVTPQKVSPAHFFKMEISFRSSLN